MKKKNELLSSFDFKQYEIKGTENEWSDALKLPTTSSYVTVKRMGEKRKVECESHFDVNNTENGNDKNHDGKKNKKNKKFDKKSNKKFKS